MASAEYVTARDELEHRRTRTDQFSVTESGDLLVEQCRAVDLIERFGSPLFVVSETTLRENYRRFRAAFGSQWPGTVRVFYAIKSNNNLAVRTILSDEGAAGECFGAAELLATLAGGTDAAQVAINGSNKTAQDLALAVEHGVIVNLDGEDECRRLAEAARAAGCRVRVNLRLKVAPPELDELASDTYRLSVGELRQDVLREKWGFSPERAVPLIKEILAADELQLLGYHLHIPRACQEPELHASCGSALVQAVADLAAKTGFTPSVLDIGGGWARERDPESRSLDLNPFTVENYADEMCRAMLAELSAASMPVPELWVEPGRYLVGNAAVLLATVGAIKRDVGHTWVNVDASTNLFARIDSRGCLARGAARDRDGPAVRRGSTRGRPGLRGVPAGWRAPGAAAGPGRGAGGPRRRHVRGVRGEPVQRNAAARHGAGLRRPGRRHPRAGDLRRRVPGQPDPRPAGEEHGAARGAESAGS